MALAGVVLSIGCAPAHAATQYEATGDALYDRYARLVLSQMAAAQWNAGPPSYLTDTSFMGNMQWAKAPGGGTQQPKQLDGAEILKWEGDYQDDPRYWELRLLVVNAEQALDFGQSPGSDARAQRRRAELDKLDALCTAGKGDEGAYDLLFTQAAQRMDQTKDTLEEVQLAVCERAIKQFPDNGYWYFMQGRLLIELGEPQRALAALKHGNSAPRQAWPQAFPCSTLFDPRYAKSKSERNRIVRGALYTVLADNIPNYIRLKETYKNATLMLALGGDPALGDELLKMAGHVGRMQQQPFNAQRVMAVLTSVIARYVSEELLSETAASDPALLKLKTCDEDFNQLPGQPGNIWPPAGAPGKLARTPYQQAVAQATAQWKANGAGLNDLRFQNLPALTKDDWLRFAEDFEDDQQRQARNASFFAAHDNPPLARLFAGEQATYRAELDALRAQSRAKRAHR
jgi:hypothetical protein